MALTHALTLAGNLVADPDLRQSPDGKPWVIVRIAVNPREYDQAAKEWKDGEPVFWEGTANGDLAEHIAHSLSKSQRVWVHGRVKSRSWTDKDSGTKRSAISIQIEDMGPSLMYMNAIPSKDASSKSADTDQWSGGQVDDDTPF